MRNITELFKINEDAYEDFSAPEEDANDESLDTTEAEEGSAPVAGAAEQEVQSEKPKDYARASKREAAQQPIQQPAQESTQEPEDAGFIDLISILHKDGLLDVDQEEELEDDLDTFKKVIEQSTNKKAEALFNSIYQNLDEKNASALRFILEGGDVEEFTTEFSGKPIDENFDISDTDNQKKIIRLWYKNQGVEDGEINEMIESFLDSDTLLKQASLAKKNYTRQQRDLVEKKIEAQKEQQAKRQQEIERSREEFKNKVLTQEKLKGFNLPKRDREKLYDYITKPVDGKRSQSEIDSSEDVDTLLLIEYLKMNKFDFSKLEKEVANKERIKLKKTLSNYKDSNAGSAKSKLNGGEIEEVESLPSRLPWQNV